MFVQPPFVSIILPDQNYVVQICSSLWARVTTLSSLWLCKQQATLLSLNWPTSDICNFPRTLPIVLRLFKIRPTSIWILNVSKLAPYWAIYVAVVYALKCNSVFGKWLKLYFNGSLITHWTAPNTDNNHSFLWGVIPQHITQSSWEIFIPDNLISAQHFIIYGALVIKYFRKSKIWSVG